jgi:hypothetical protein
VLTSGLCAAQLLLPHAVLCCLVEALVIAGCAPAVPSALRPIEATPSMLPAGGSTNVMRPGGGGLRNWLPPPLHCGPLHGHCPAALSGGWGWLAEAALVWVSVAAVATAMHVMAARRAAAAAAAASLPVPAAVVRGKSNMEKSAAHG